MSRLRRGDVVAGIGGVILLVSLWLHWYGFDPSGLVKTIGASGTVQLNTFSDGPAFSAWQAFSILDIVLAVIALVAIGVPVLTATTKSPAKPVAFAVTGTVLSALAVLLILYRIANQPGSNALVAVKPGAWIGLAGALIAAVGCWWAMADEHTPGAAPPDLPVRPAP
jgi:hypothetical protein